MPTLVLPLLMPLPLPLAMLEGVIALVFLIRMIIRSGAPGVARIRDNTLGTGGAVILLLSASSIGPAVAVARLSATTALAAAAAAAALVAVMNVTGEAGLLVRGGGHRGR